MVTQPDFWGFEKPRAAPIVGIDIGQKGALAYTMWNEDRSLISATVFDLPHMQIFERQCLDIIKLMEMIEDHCYIKPAVVAVEEPVVAYRGQGVMSSGKSMTTTLMNYGRLSYVLEACFGEERCFSVAPATWKRHLGVGKDKEDAVRLSCLNFPGVADQLASIGKRGAQIVHDGRAEALLIAWYAAHNLWLPEREDVDTSLHDG